MINNICTHKTITALESLGYAVFESDEKPFNINIVGIREDNPTPNKFNDAIIVFWKNEGRWNKFQMQCTTLAGLYYLKKPMSPKGCAILTLGQHRGAYAVGNHNGYEALVQRKPLVVLRDNDKDSEYDMDTPTESGNFGINIHRAHSKAELENVGKFSAGCQVIQDPDEFDIFMAICNKARKHWGNSFTYTLIKESEYNG